MTDFRGRKLKDAGPSVPVEIIGMGEVPEAGDDFYAVADERMARAGRAAQAGEKKDAMNPRAEGHPGRPVQPDQGGRDEEPEHHRQGRCSRALPRPSRSPGEAEQRGGQRPGHPLRSGRHQRESDVMLASTSNAIIVGFNVTPDAQAKLIAERDKVDMRMYRVIYECIEEIEVRHEGYARSQVQGGLSWAASRCARSTKITGVGIVAGSYVLEGKVTRNAQLRLVRDGIVIHEGEIASLQRFKDSVKEVAAGYECGITLEKFSDLKVGDVLEGVLRDAGDER